MQKRDLQQISSLLDQKLDQKFKENNKEIYKELNDTKKSLESKIDEQENLISAAIKDGFGEMDVKISKIEQEAKELKGELKEVKEELKKKPNEDRILKWADEQVTPVKLDVDKLKYIHRDAWQDLPDGGTVSRVLIAKRIK